MDTLEIIRQMRADPALAEEMRAIILDDELRNLPATVNKLVEVVKALEKTVEAHTKIIEANSRAIEELTEVTRKQGDLLDKQGERLDKQGARLDRMDGDLQEIIFKGNVEDVLYGHIDGAKLLSRKEIDQLIAKAEQSIQNEARKRLFKTDGVVAGKEWGKSTRVYGVIEVSTTVGMDDITRAKRGADLLASAGSRAVAVVVGREITHEARVSCENGDAVFISTAKDAA
jgi:hypothetical protein